jgi:hypothetical protein
MYNIHIIFPVVIMTYFTHIGILPKCEMVSAISMRTHDLTIALTPNKT